MLDVSTQVFDVPYRTVPYLISMWQCGVLNEVITPDTRTVVHRVAFLVEDLVSLGDHSAAQAHTAATNLSRSSHLSLSLYCLSSDRCVRTVFMCTFFFENLCSCVLVRSNLAALL